MLIINVENVKITLSGYYEDVLNNILNLRIVQYEVDKLSIILKIPGRVPDDRRADTTFVGMCLWAMTPFGTFLTRRPLQDHRYHGHGFTEGEATSTFVWGRHDCSEREEFGHGGHYFGFAAEPAHTRIIFFWMYIF